MTIVSYPLSAFADAAEVTLSIKAPMNMTGNPFSTDFTVTFGQCFFEDFRYFSPAYISWDGHSLNFDTYFDNWYPVQFPDIVVRNGSPVPVSSVNVPVATSWDYNEPRISQFIDGLPDGDEKWAWLDFLNQRLEYGLYLIDNKVLSSKLFSSVYPTLIDVDGTSYRASAFSSISMPWSDYLGYGNADLASYLDYYGTEFNIVASVFGSIETDFLGPLQLPNGEFHIDTSGAVQLRDFVFYAVYPYSQVIFGLAPVSAILALFAFIALIKTVVASR